MVEMRNGKKVLITPVSTEDLKDIKVGDIVYLDGSMTTCRDVAHRRLVEEGRELPVDVRNNAIFHAGPIIRPLENDKFEMVSVGPTTSMRMEKFEYEFVKETGVKVTGATVHFVDTGTDTGPIILQKAVKIKSDDTPEVLQRRVMEKAEWKILPKAINLIANDKVKVVDGRVETEEFDTEE